MTASALAAGPPSHPGKGGDSVMRLTPLPLPPPVCVSNFLLDEMRWVVKYGVLSMLYECCTKCKSNSGKTT